MMETVEGDLDEALVALTPMVPRPVVLARRFLDPPWDLVICPRRELL